MPFPTLTNEIIFQLLFYLDSVRTKRSILIFEFLYLPANKALYL